MADYMTMMSGEDQRHVAIPICSSARSTAGAMLAPLEPQVEVMHKLLKDQDDLDAEEHRPEVPLIKKVVAEYVGTFMLTFTVLSSIVRQEKNGGVLAVLGVAALAGLTATTLVGVVVRISGSHLNPAVSLAMAAFGHLPCTHVLPYAAAQTLASTAAASLAKAMYHLAEPDIMATVPPLGGTAAYFFMELVLTFVLVLAISAGTNHPTQGEFLAVIIPLMVATSMKWPSTGPSMNPARTLGTVLVTGKYTDIWVYMVAPPLGAIAGAGTYTLIKPWPFQTYHVTK